MGRLADVAWPDEEDVPLVSHIARLRSTLPMPPLPLVDLLVARNFDGATISRLGTGAVQLARRTKDEQVPICRDQVSLQSTSRQSFCYTDPAEPGDAQRFGTEMIGVRT